jgi:hypothetical protein
MSHIASDAQARSNYGLPSKNSFGWKSNFQRERAANRNKNIP